jgi:hypothetical protein
MTISSARTFDKKLGLAAKGPQPSRFLKVASGIDMIQPLVFSGICCSVVLVYYQIALILRT